MEGLLLLLLADVDPDSLANVPGLDLLARRESDVGVRKGWSLLLADAEFDETVEGVWLLALV